MIDCNSIFTFKLKCPMYEIELLFQNLFCGIYSSIIEFYQKTESQALSVQHTWQIYLTLSCRIKFHRIISNQFIS